MAQMLSVISPYDGVEVGQVPIAEMPEIEAAFTIAEALHKNKSAWLALHTRVAIF